MLRAASATAMAHPLRGSASTYRPLQSTLKAKPLVEPLTWTTAASPGRLVERFTVPTMLSYCSYTQRLDARLGRATKALAVAT